MVSLMFRRLAFLSVGLAILGTPAAAGPEERTLLSLRADILNIEIVDIYRKSDDVISFTTESYVDRIKGRWFHSHDYDCQRNIQYTEGQPPKSLEAGSINLEIARAACRYLEPVPAL